MNQQEQMAFFYELFDAKLPRLGPGDDFSTKKALDMLLAVVEFLGIFICFGARRATGLGIVRCAVAG